MLRGVRSLNDEIQEIEKTLYNTQTSKQQWTNHKVTLYCFHGHVQMDFMIPDNITPHFSWCVSNTIAYWIIVHIRSSSVMRPLI